MCHTLWWMVIYLSECWRMRMREWRTIGTFVKSSNSQKTTDCGGEVAVSDKNKENQDDDACLETVIWHDQTFL